MEWAHNRFLHGLGDIWVVKNEKFPVSQMNHKQEMQ